MAVRICESNARWTASLRTNDATDAEKAVPFKMPRCSFDPRVSGSMLCWASALLAGRSERVLEAVDRQMVLIEGFPIKVPAIYESGDRSPEAEMLPRRGTSGVMCSRSKCPICSMSSKRTPE